MQYDHLPLHYFAKDIKKSIRKGRSKGLIFGNFGACNVGDEAILAGELAELKKIPATKIKVISRYPQKVTALHNVEAVPFFSVFSSLRNIFLCDYLIFGGGGLICKNDMGIRGILFQLYTLGMFLLLPIMLRKKVFVVGLGIYENTPRLTAILALILFRYVHLLSVRDQSSYQFLKKNHLPVKYYKDSSFLLPLERKDLSPFNTNGKKFTVGLAINKPHKGNNLDKYISEIVLFITRYKDIAHFVFYTLDYHPLYSNDRRFAKRIIKKAEESSEFNYEFFQIFKHPKDVFSSFYHLDFMIASRLHSAIFSHRIGIPFYGIAYDAKCESFLSSVSHQSTVPDMVTANDISLYFQSIMEKKDTTTKPLHTSFERVSL